MLSNIFKALISIVPTQEVRYYLVGVYMSFDGVQTCTFEATDGHRLARICVDADKVFAKPTPRPTEPFSIIIPADTVKDAIRGLRKDSTLHLEHVAGMGYSILKHVYGGSIQKRVYGGTVSMSFTPIDGRWPQTQRVIPLLNRTANIQEGIGLDANYIADINTFAKAVYERTKQLGVTLHFGTGTDATRISFDVESTPYTELVYVVMPCRVKAIKKDAA